MNKPGPFNRTTAPYAEKFKTKLFDLAEEARVAGGLKKIDSDRAFLIDLDPSRTTLDLVHLKDYQPIDEVTYRQKKEDIFNKMNQLPPFAFFQWPESLNEKAVKKRLNYTVVGAIDDEEDSDDETKSETNK